MNYRNTLRTGFTTGIRKAPTPARTGSLRGSNAQQVHTLSDAHIRHSKEFYYHGKWIHIIRAKPLRTPHRGTVTIPHFTNDAVRKAVKQYPHPKPSASLRCRRNNRKGCFLNRIKQQQHFTENITELRHLQNNTLTLSD